MEIGSKDKDSIITVLICLVSLFSMEAKRISHLGFAITNIVKIFNKYNFKCNRFSGISDEIFYLCFNRIQPL